MKYVAALIWALICLGIIFLFLFSISKADAFDYFPNNLDTLQENAVICVIDPPKEYLFYILKAVNSWDHYMNTNWYTVKVIHLELFDCNAAIIFKSPVDVFDDTQNEFGITKCWKSPILKQFGESFEISRYCKAAVNLETADWYRTIVHEVGHILGLGHRLPYDAKDFAYVFLQHDLMFSNIDNQSTITNESRDALWHFRTYPQLEQNYTIPHD